MLIRMTITLACNECGGSESFSVVPGPDVKGGLADECVRQSRKLGWRPAGQKRVDGVLCKTHLCPDCAPPDPPKKGGSK